MEKAISTLPSQATGKSQADVQLSALGKDTSPTMQAARIGSYFVPGVGTARSIGDTISSAQKGDIAGTALNAAGVVAPFVIGAAAKGVTKVAAKAQPALDFKKAYKAQNLTDYSKSGVSQYAHPDYVASIEKIGTMTSTRRLSKPTARQLARETLDKFTEDAALERIALQAQKYWESKPDDMLAIYSKLEQSPDVINNNLQGYLNNIPSMIAGRSSAQIEKDIARLSAKQKAAASYLSSPLTAGNRIADTFREAIAASEGGFSSASPLSVSRGVVSALDNLPAGARATILNQLARHRSSSSDLANNMLHPMDVPVASGRVFGPGTYLAQTPVASQALFSSFGENIYKLKSSPADTIKTLMSKGYIDISDPKASGITSAEWNSPLIQDLMKQGYIGLKHGDALTNWKVGTPGGPGLKLTKSDKLDSTLAKSALSAKLGKTNKQLKDILVQKTVQAKKIAPTAVSQKTVFDLLAEMGNRIEG